MSMGRIFWVAILLMVNSFHSFAQNTIDKETIKLNHNLVTVEEAIDEIKNQTGVIISYSADRVDLNKQILLRGNFFKLRDFVNIVFVDQNLRPVIKNDKKIVLVYDHVNGLRQAKRMLSGVVRDASSGEPLIGAHVYDQYGLNGTFTNELGLFQIQSPASLDSIWVSYLGYDNKSVASQKLMSDPYEIRLKGNLKLEEITIKHEKEDDDDIRINGNHYLGARNFLNSFGTVGDNDPMVSVLKLASVQSGHEGENSVYMRGGSPDQNLILMDGVPLYETTHILGISSIFNNDAVKNIQLYKHAFPSKFGGRLSSVIDFQMNEGDLYNHRKTLSLSPFSAKVHIEGPLATGKTSYNLSYRRSLVNLFFDNALEDLLDYSDTQINYFDFNAKISHEIEPGNKLFFTMYMGKDDVELARTENLKEDGQSFEISNRDNVKWGNRIASLQWQKIINAKSYTKFNIFYSHYSSDSRSVFEFMGTEQDTMTTSALDILAKSRIQDAGVKAEFNYFLNNRMRIVTGTGILYHNYTPTLRQSTQVLQDPGEVENQENIRADEFYLFGEIQHNLSESFLLQTGIRFSQFLVRNRSYGNIEPRLSLTKRFDGGKHALSASATRMSQYIHLLVNPGIGLPSDLWIPSTDLLPPETATQYAFSYNYKMFEGVDFSIDGYWKSMQNVIDYSSPFDLFYTFINDTEIEENFVQSGDWENFVNTGNSTSKGMEFSLSKTSGKFQGLLAYTLSKTDRVFQYLNDGKPFPYKFDRRHDWSISGTYQFNDAWSINANWVYGTGDAFSLALEQYIGIDGNPLQRSEGRNNFRFPSFHRLDIGIKYQKALTNKNQLKLDLGVYNVYNRQNTFYVYIFENPITNSAEQRNVSIFPILPHFNFYVSF